MVNSKEKTQYSIKILSEAKDSLLVGGQGRALWMWTM